MVLLALSHLVLCVLPIMWATVDSIFLLMLGLVSSQLHTACSLVEPSRALVRRAGEPVAMPLVGSVVLVGGSSGRQRAIFVLRSGAIRCEFSAPAAP